MNNSVINIAFCTDNNYLEYVAIAIKSIQLNNLNNNIQFHVFVYDVSQENINKFLELNTAINIYPVPLQELEKYRNDHQLVHLNRSMYIRLLVPRLLQGKVNKFIYLDADTLCFHDISAINDINIDEVVCAVVPDSLKSVNIAKNVSRLKLTSSHYFNSGFLYINVKKWCGFDVENKVNAILSSENQIKLTYPDQDALNIVLQDNVKFIETKWNYLYTWMNDQEKNEFFFKKQNLPFIVHYTGARKPWYQEHTGLAQDLYIFYKHFTPWANEPLQSYLPRMRVNDYRIYAKDFMKKGSLLRGISFYIKYITKKTRVLSQKN